MKLLFEQKIRLGFSLALVFLLVLGGVGWWSAARSIRAFHGVDQTHQILDELDDTSARGYVFSGNELYLKSYQSGLDAFERSRKELRRLTHDSQILQSKLNSL